MSAFELPMADGHVHANGMLDDETVLILADKYQVDLRTYSPNITETGRRIWANYNNFHKAYDAGVGLIREPNDLHFVVKKYLTTVAHEGCVYADIFASGMNNYNPILGDAWPFFRENTKATLRAMNEACAETGIESSLVITFKRHLKDAVNAAHQLVTLTRKFKEADLDPEDRINAFHLAGDEVRDTCPSFEAFAPVYERAYTELGMNRNGTHVGEKKPAKDIWNALAISHISRFGHALSAAGDEKLMKDIRSHDVAIEILPTSNARLLGLEPKTHPIHAFLAHGISTILGSDDPGILRSDISGEYKKAAKEFGLLSERLFSITVNAVRHGFAPLSRRRKVLEKLEAYNGIHGMGLGESAFVPAKVTPAQIAGRNDLRIRLIEGLAMGG